MVPALSFWGKGWLTIHPGPQGMTTGAREALLTALRAVRDDRKALDAWRNRGKECRILR